ncbi:MAG: sulfotransferase family protein [Phycisphaerales bacterium]
MARDALKPPIILLGNVRSGTTMMMRLFDAHPGVVGWFEPRTIWVYGDPWREHDRYDASDATPRVKAYIRKRFLQMQRSHGGARVMEKTPSNILRVPFVAEVFPESKFLYLVREPLANVSSSELFWRKTITITRAWERFVETPKRHAPGYFAQFAREWWRRKVLKDRHTAMWGVRYPGVYEDRARMSVEELIAKQWVEGARWCERDLKDLPQERVLRVRYEDFVSEPVEKFGEILRFFGEEFPEETREFVRRTVDPHRQTKWKRMDAATIRRILPIVREEMLAHGYSVPDEAELAASESAGAGVGAA